MTERCGRVEPYWVRLRDVLWAGSSAPTPNHAIEYRQCPNEGVVAERGGYVGALCPKHEKDFRG